MTVLAHKFLNKLEKNLYGKQVVVLSGAGASAGYVHSTASVTAALKNWTKYYIPSVAQLGFPRLMNDIEYDPLRTPAQVKYFQGLYDALSTHYSNPLEFLHFERLIHVAQILDQYTTETKNSDNDYLKVGAGALLELANSYAAFDNKTHGNIASQATAFILNLFASQQQGLKSLGDIPLNQFLREISKGSYLRVHSLNYDTIPVNSGINFKTGFLKTPGAINEESFSLNDLRYSFRSHVFCQLHGSSQFGFASEESSRGLLVRFNDLQTASDSRTAIAVSNNYAQDGIEGLSQLMIAGLRKADAILHDPFASYFNRMSTDLINCDAVVVIGYGGHDKHVNEIFQRSYLAREALSLKNKIVWIDYSPEIDFSSGVACHHRNPEPWKKIHSAASILPKGFFHTFNNEVKEDRLKLYRSEKNIFFSGRSRVLFRLNGANDALSGSSQKQILDFLIG